MVITDSASTNPKRSKLERTRAKLRRAKSTLKREVFTPQHLILLAIPVLIIGWFIGTISLLNRIWELQQQIATRSLEKQRLSLEIDTLALENQYRASEEYQELAARHLQNKQLPGETMIYLPKNSEAAKNKYSTPVATSPEPDETSNFAQWMTYLFGF